MPDRLSRREFLRDLAVGAGGLCFLPAISRASQRGRLRLAGPPQNIIVLGAGLAGLSAAFELQNAGHSVTILEARKGVGGRVSTIRSPFSDGLYAEAGALSFPPTHEFTWGYATDFQLPLRPSFVPGRDHLGDLDRTVFKILADGSANIPFDLTKSESQAGIFGLTELYWGDLMANTGNPRKPGWPPDNLAALDQISTKQFLINLGASDGAIQLLDASQLGLLGFGIDSVSALDAVFQESIAINAPFYEIIGGNDQLPQAFRDRFNGSYRKKSIVQSIQQNDTSVTVTYMKGGVSQTITGDRVISALPFTIMANIPVDPPFSAIKQQAISELKLTPVTRTYLQFSSRPWEQQNLDGYAITDLNIQNTYSPTLTQSNPKGILTSYTGGQRALDIAAMAEKDRQNAVLNGMDKVFGSLDSRFELGTSQIWQEDPFTLGAYTYFQPGQMTTLLPAAQAIEGRIHFAGEHTSAWHGWMNGALESGNRAADEVNQAGATEVIRIRS